METSTAAATMEAGLQGIVDWWERVNASTAWQEHIFLGLATAYAIVSLVALIQLIRIELRVPEYGWTTQKVFHLLNFFVNGGKLKCSATLLQKCFFFWLLHSTSRVGLASIGCCFIAWCAVRAAVFCFRENVQALSPEVLQHVLLDLPGLLFFTTYTLLVLFWAEIYYQARSLPTDNLRPAFLITNATIYFIQACIWVCLWWSPSPVVLTVAKVFFAGVSLVAALGFLLYGGRLFLMLRRFPIESKGRRNKLREVGCVTAICFTCFTVRSVIMTLSVFYKGADLDVLYHPILNAIYYMLVEIVPSALVLYILRKMPPKRMGGQYHPIR